MARWDNERAEARVGLSMYRAENELLIKLRRYFEDKEGKRLSHSEIVRRALHCLAEKHWIKLDA